MKAKTSSLTSSRRLPEERMTVMGDIPIPAVPGSCYHAILCSLIANKNKFVSWIKLRSLVEQNLLTYGGDEAWNRFAFRTKSKKNIDNEYILKKIKTNTHTLTRIGKNAYGYRLHVRGIVIYFFKDGAIARTGGEFMPAKGRKPYSVRFHDGSGLQVRSRGKIMSYREYRDVVGNISLEEEETENGEIT